MSSPIECHLSASTLALVPTLAPVPALTGLALLAHLPWYWLLPAAAVTQGVFWQCRPTNPPAPLLRWRDDRLVLLDPDAPHQAETYRWTGRGRRTAWYLRLELAAPDGRRWPLMIWRDSLSEASWRALNAQYRILEGQAR